MFRYIKYAVFVLIIFWGISGLAQENVAPRTITIVIQKGNTLWGIASNYLNDPYLWPELLKYNDIDNPNLILAGNSLKVPISSEEDAQKALQKLEEYMASHGKSQQEIEEALHSAKSAFKAGDYGLAHGLASKEIEDITGVKAAVERSVKIVLIKGKVMIRRFGELEWENAHINMKLNSGDAIRTHSASHAEILFDNTNRLNVKPDALIVIGDLTEDRVTRKKSSSVKIFSSVVSATVQKNEEEAPAELQIQTPSATAKINEAQLAVRVNDDKTSEFRVFSGSTTVVTENNEELNLTANKALLVDAETVTIKDLPPPPMLKSPQHQDVLYFANAQSGQVELAWEAVAGISAYHLEIARYRSFVDYVGQQKNWGSTNYTVTNLSDGIYYWRVSSISASGLKGKPSEYRIFMVSTSRDPGIVGHEKGPLLAVSEPQLRGGELYLDTVFISGDTEPDAIVEINGNKVDVDLRGGFKVEFKNQLEGLAVYTIRSIGKNGAISFIQKDVYIEKVKIFKDPNNF